MDGHGMPPGATWTPWTQPYNEPSSSSSSSSYITYLVEAISSLTPQTTMASQTCEALPPSLISAAATETVTFDQLCTRLEPIAGGSVTLITNYLIVTGPSATVSTSFTPVLPGDSSSQEAMSMTTVTSPLHNPFMTGMSGPLWTTITTAAADWSWDTLPTASYSTSLSRAEASSVVLAMFAIESSQSTTWTSLPDIYWEYNIAKAVLLDRNFGPQTTSIIISTLATVPTTFATFILPSPYSIATLPTATSSAAGANDTLTNTTSDPLGHSLAIALPLTFFFLTAVIVLFTTWRRCFCRKDTEEILRRNLLKEAAERAKRKPKVPLPRGKHVDLVEASGRKGDRAKSFSTGTTAFSPVIGKASMKEVETPRSGSIVIGYDTREVGGVSFLEG